MKKEEIYAMLRRKVLSLLWVSVFAFIISAVVVVILYVLPFLLSSETFVHWEGEFVYFTKHPSALREFLLKKGEDAAWLFVLIQVLQVVIAPIPGQVAALAGGFVFGFWKGWLLTTVGLFIGSTIAMVLARILGEGLVRRIVPSTLFQRFDYLISDGGYTTFFMIFLLPALPDDAVCFLAGLTRLKLVTLSLVCLIGRAPGMAVLSFAGAGFSGGFTLTAKVLFAVMMVISVLLWLFWEAIEAKTYQMLLPKS